MWRYRTNDLSTCEPIRRSNLPAYGLAAAILFAPSGISAQTAEDTVAFILFGLENGAISNGIEMTPWKTERTGDFFTDLPLVMRLSVRKVRDCVYAITISAPKQVRKSHLDDKMIVVTADFTKIYSIRYEQPLGRLIAGLPKAVCEYLTEHNNPTNISMTKCTDAKSEQYFPALAQTKQIAAATNLNRVDGAVGYFKNVFCPMRGF